MTPTGEYSTLKRVFQHYCNSNVVGHNDAFAISGPQIQQFCIDCKLPRECVACSCPALLCSALLCSALPCSVLFLTVALALALALPVPRPRSHSYSLSSSLAPLLADSPLLHCSRRREEVAHWKKTAEQGDHGTIARLQVPQKSRINGKSALVTSPRKEPYERLARAAANEAKKEPS